MEKKCSCGCRFLVLSPKHTRCKRCHKAHRIVVSREQAEREGRDALRETLKLAFVGGTLPKSAKVTRLGQQVSVAWQGRSHTFHLGRAT